MQFFTFTGTQFLLLHPVLQLFICKEIQNYLHCCLPQVTYHLHYRQNLIKSAIIVNIILLYPCMQTKM